MDWNNDGKHDWKDDSFFQNVVLKDAEKQEEEKSNKNSSSLQESNSSKGLVCFVILCIVYFLSKLF